VTRSQDADRLGQLLASERLDLLVNNAAADDAHGMSLATVDAERWKSVFATNVIGPALVTRALVPALRLAPQPAVVNLGSRQGSITSNSSGGRYAYRTSKAALSMLTKTLALDLRDFGITCVSVHPGWVRTELGGPEAPLEAGQSAAALRVLIAGLDRAASGTFLDYTGESIPW
jgi:NAD(P)-dependent dehydrogenase (short-subunit alcohol dehydrogenase family)